MRLSSFHAELVFLSLLRVVRNMALVQSVCLLLKFFSFDSFFSSQTIRGRLLLLFFFFSSSLLFSSCFHLLPPLHPSSSLQTSSSLTSPLLSRVFPRSVSSTSSSHLSSLFFFSPSPRPSFSLSSSPCLLLSSFQLHLSVTPSSSFFFCPTSSSSSSLSVLFATLRSGRPKASRSSKRQKKEEEEEDDDDDDDEEAEDDEEDRASFSFDPTKVTSRFGNLTGGGVYTPETAPPFPAETAYFPSFPPKYVTPVPQRLPRWHPKSPFPSLQPRGPFYPEVKEEGKEKKKQKKTPKFRQFKGKAPPPESLPSPVIELEKNFKSWVRTPYYQYPQFTSLSASIRYRRRLKKTSRRLELRLAKNLPYRRMYFAWRRNMRDQEMHRWMCEKARVSLLTSRYWKHRYALQASEWLASRKATESLQGEQDEDNKDHLHPMKEEEEVEIEEEEEEGGECDDIEEEMQNKEASSSKTPDSSLEREGLHTTIFGGGQEVAKEEEEEVSESEMERRRIHNEIVSYIEQHQDLCEEIVYQGYQLPRMTAAIASSPFPWWSSAKGLHKWRGRRTSSNVQSRWINWSKPMRTIEAAVGDRLIPRGGKILAFLKQKGKELEETLARGERLQGRDAESGNGDEEDMHKREKETTTEEKEEREEDEEDREDMKEREEERNDQEEEEEEPEETGEEENEDDREDCMVQSQEDTKRMKEEKEKKEEEEEEEMRRTRKRRAIEAAMDVSILLGQSLITKESGARNPYDVYSPFMKTERSSRRRRMRLRGRKSLLEHAEEKNLSRQERRLTRFAKRREERRDRQDSDNPRKG